MLIFPALEQRRRILKSLPPQEDPRLKMWAPFTSGSAQAAASQYLHLYRKRGSVLLFNALTLGKAVGGDELAELHRRLVESKKFNFSELREMAFIFGGGERVVRACLEAPFVGIPEKERAQAEEAASRVAEVERSMPLHLEILLDGDVAPWLPARVRAFQEGGGGSGELEAHLHLVEDASPFDAAGALVAQLRTLSGDGRLRALLHLPALPRRAGSPCFTPSEIRVAVDMSRGLPRGAAAAASALRSACAAVVPVLTVEGSPAKELPARAVAAASAFESSRAVLRFPPASPASGEARAKAALAVFRALRDEGVRELSLFPVAEAIAGGSPVIAGCRVGGGRMAVRAGGGAAWCLPLLESGVESREAPVQPRLPLERDECRACPAIGVCRGVCEAVGEAAHCAFMRGVVEGLLDEVIDLAGGQARHGR